MPVRRTWSLTLSGGVKDGASDGELVFMQLIESK
jgi:hypothetical protein